MSQYTPIDVALHSYLSAHRTPDDPILRELQEETRRSTGERAVMQIAPEEGTLLGVLVAATGARRVVEVGTFTGYSALCMARALPPGGRLLACDVSEEYTAVARRYWAKAGVADRIELVLGPALETLRAQPDEICFDFGFIDADKGSYRAYYEEILRRLRPGGLIAIDNVLWSGQVLRESDQSEDTVAIRALNEHVAADRRVRSVMIGVADGITLACKLG
ncbi:MAG: methyltransferase domain-containing protein [Deltaproteobacteria bacterium]|nr:methyltransferase domain-containing protein [Deltaproteobacteria bacterium]